MTLPEYVYDHLIDLDLMSKSELRDLIESIYDHLNKNLLNYDEQDAKLLDLLVDLRNHLYSDEVAWITRYKYYNS